MADDRNVEPIRQVLALGAPYPMVVLPVDGEYWMEGNYHILSRDTNDRPLYPSIDMSRCTLDEDENIYNYRRNFSGKEHINYAGEDIQLGPILMSVLLDLSVNDGICDQYLVVLRTKTKTLFRIIPTNSMANEMPGPRDFMRYILGQEPEVDHFHAIALPRASDDVIHFDEHTATSCHKVGVLYQSFGQINEEDYLQNQEVSPAFQEFMELISEKVNLKDFPNYRGGLDVRYGQTGEFSYYTNFKNRELMFHVSPLLPYTANDSQQLGRKRHIGNDVVSLIFQETNTPFCPSSIRSHVLHVFIVIQVENANTEDTCYKVSVTAKEGVPKFAPTLPNPCIFKKGPEFRHFLLTKIINGESAALKCEKFSALGERTRASLLEQVVTELITRNERLLEDITELNDSPQKTNSFLSTFRSAWHRNGRSTSNPANQQTLKATKNLGQSLSLNDLTLLEVEDGKKDLKISSKEKKRMKKKSNNNNLVPILKSQSFTIENELNTSEMSPKLRPRSAYQVDTDARVKATFYLDQAQRSCDTSTYSNSLPRNASSPTSPTNTSASSTQNGYTTNSTDAGCASGDHIDVAVHSLALASARAEIESLKSEVNKIKLDKMDLVRQNVILQREIKKLNERYSSSRDDTTHLRANQHRKEKRKSAILVTSTEFV